MTTPAPLAFFRFDEVLTAVQPSDAMKSVGDLGIDTGLTMPPVVDAFAGRGRSFSNGFALDALDVVAGSSLTTRDVSVQAIISWDIVAQNALGTVGTIVARGKGAAAAEYVAYAVELRVVNAGSRIGELRFWWQDTAGAIHTQLGGQFVVPLTGYVLLTAARHWVSGTSVELRYYAGDQLIGEFLSVDGDIGGGTTGTFCVGTRYSAAVAGNFLCGVIDELRILPYEITAEEIAATWDRMSRLQPRGYHAVKEMFQPGAPISDDPGSRIQKLFRIAGHGLGYAAAQIENVRQNLLPDRAYGPALEQWESILGEAPRGPDTVVQRRKRLIGHLRQRAGSSVPGVQAMTADMLALNQSQVQVLAFDNTVREDFSGGLKTERWDATPSAQWSIAAAALRVQAANAANIMADWSGGGQVINWYKCLAAAGADGRGVRMIAKIVPTTIPDQGEVGIMFLDAVSWNAILFGVRKNGANYQIITEQIIAQVSQGVTVQAATASVTHWLHLFQQDTFGLNTPAFGSVNRNYTAAWSTTGQLSGYTNSPNINHKPRFQFAGLYARGFSAALGAALDVSFDDVIIRSPYNTRTDRWYVYRDPTLPGTADLIASHAAIQRLKHAHTGASVITSKSALADSAISGADRGPAGAL